MTLDRHGNCRVLTAHSSPSCQLLSLLSGSALIASCHHASLLAMPALTTRRMLCLNQHPPQKGHLGHICQVAPLTACLLLSQEDAAGLATLQAIWAGSLLPVHTGSITAIMGQQLHSALQICTGCLLQAAWHQAQTTVHISLGHKPASPVDMALLAVVGGVLVHFAVLGEFTCSHLSTEAHVAPNSLTLLLFVP